MEAAGAKYSADMLESDAATAKSQSYMTAGSTLLAGATKTLTLMDKYWPGTNASRSYTDVLE